MDREKKNAEIEKQIERADRAIRECERRGVDPVEALERACKEKDE